MLLDEKLNG